MALYTGCIYSPRESTHGTRISVMSRHTLDDGITLDPRITPAQYDEWLKELAPRNVGKYYRKQIGWVVFEILYRRRLAGKTEQLRELGRRAEQEDITLLCKEETPEFCHRRILAEEIKKRSPGLDVIIG
jgi:uncharacterized protein YeaO (DUF488 family)